MAFKPTWTFGGSSNTKPLLNISANQPAPTAATSSAPSLFGGLSTQAATTAPAAPSLFGPSTTTTTQPAPTSLFGGPTATNANNTSIQGNAPTSTAAAAASAPQIDEAHLRSTTRFDHLAPHLQEGISALDTAILNQIRQCQEVSDLLPAVSAAGAQIEPAIDFVSGKLEELETGLENDAENIVTLRDDVVRKDAGEARCVFRAVDRLKVPRQYQVGHTANPSQDGRAFGDVSNGLTGWWNQPSTHLRGSLRASGAGQSVQLVDDDVEDDGGPKSLVTLFDDRSKEQAQLAQRHVDLLGEIENFVDGLEAKVVSRERELADRLGSEEDGQKSSEDEKNHQMQLLKYVFGEVQRNLYEVAEKVGAARDGVTELGLGR